jgi:peptidoglycan hydrolase CwlO-like protein
MRTFLILTLLISLISCGDNSPVITNSGINVDSLIEKNKETFETATEANKKSDTSITTKVETTVKKIGELENEIKELKEENNELKDKLDDAGDAGKPFRIRSISNDKKD